MIKTLIKFYNTHFKNYLWPAFKLALATLSLFAVNVFGAEQQAILNDKLDIKANRSLKIVYIMKAEESGNPYWPQVRQGAEQAGKDYNVHVDVRVPRAEAYDIAAQIDLVKSLKNTDINGLVIIPIDTQALAAPVEELIDAGIPVVVHDTPLNSTKVLTQLSFDNFQVGFKVASWVSKQLKGKGQVAILEGQRESFNAIERRDGFLAGLAEGKLKVMDIRPANWLREDAKQIVRQWLKSYPNLAAIMAASDAMALGAQEAVAEAGRKDILITGIDSSEETLRAIAKGHISATVGQSPEQQARKAVQLVIRNILKGETYPEVLIWNNSPLVTTENVKYYLK